MALRSASNCAIIAVGVADETPGDETFLLGCLSSKVTSFYVSNEAFRVDLAFGVELRYIPKSPCRILEDEKASRQTEKFRRKVNICREISDNRLHSVTHLLKFMNHPER